MSELEIGVTVTTPIEDVERWSAARTEATCCKLHASEREVRVADRAMQIHGGCSYVTEYPAERYAVKNRGGILDPEDIAEAYWQLHRQPRSAWTQELDLRPWMENV